MNNVDVVSKSSGPKGLGSDVRGELLRAGHALYEARGFDGVSLRDVAERAGVNQAMVRYYFRDKNGYEAALLDEGIDRYLDAVSGHDSFRDFIAAAIATLNDMAWLPVLMMRSVYASNDLRARFIEVHTPRIIAAMQVVYQPRGNLKLPHVFLSIISLLIFPQLARPVVGPVLGIGFDDRFADQFADHIAILFEGQAF